MDWWERKSITCCPDSVTLYARPRLNSVSLPLALVGVSTLDAESDARIAEPAADADGFRILPTSSLLATKSCELLTKIATACKQGLFLPERCLGKCSCTLGIPDNIQIPEHQTAQACARAVNTIDIDARTEND